MNLNEVQYEAAIHKDGPCMLLAGPGSGKTLTVVKRIEYLIEKHKVRPEEILVITFTKAASKEMKSRFTKEMQGTYYPVTFGTFHGIYYGILKWAYRMNADNIFSEEEKYQLLRQVVIQTEPDYEDEKEFLQELAGEIGIIKNNQLEIAKYHSLHCEEVFREIFKIYEEKRKEAKKIDFDDMLVLCYELFQKRPEVLKLWQEKFRYILVDEFQDINQVQYDVIKMLAAPLNNLFIVGDDDQSIYRFRGARPEIMLHFTQDYPDARTLALQVNYRSTKAIVNVAKRVIEKNHNRYPKAISTTNEQGVNVHVQEVLDPVEESKYVMSQIQERKNQGVHPEHIAVLFRTNTEAMALAETMAEYHIPYQMKEHLPNLYEHFIGQDLLTYMKMALGERTRAQFLRVMNRPNRYIGRDCIEKKEISFASLKGFYRNMEWMQDRIDQWELDLRLMKNMTPYAAIQFIRKHIGYDGFLEEYGTFRRIPLEDLKGILKEIQERTKGYQTMEEWFAHVENYTAQWKSNYQYQEPHPDAVNFLTMHGAKGLEFDTVFLIGANETLTPHKKAVTEADLEEERRMFYVAMTRAKKRLLISYTKERSGKAMEPSRFVTELLHVEKKKKEKG